MHFIINKTVTFNVAERTIANETSKHQLSNPACRLLLVLLENNNALITREDLLQKVWGDFGLAPSGNSLNNNVSILRKIFSELDIHDVLKTIPKQGFVLSIDDLQFNDKSRDYMVMQALAHPDKESTTPRKWFFVAGGVFLFLLLIAVACFLFLFKHDDEVYLFKKIDECNVYYFKNVNVKHVERYFSEGAGAELIKHCSQPSLIYYDDSKAADKSDMLEIFVAQCKPEKTGAHGECKNYVTSQSD